MITPGSYPVHSTITHNVGGGGGGGKWVQLQQENKTNASQPFIQIAHILLSTTAAAAAHWNDSENPIYQSQVEKGN